MQLHYVLQTLLRGRGSNLLKIVSLALALTMSILLFSRVAFERSYDTCFSEPQRILQLFSVFTINGERIEEELNLPPVAGAILENFPQEVESAVCICKYLVRGPLYNGSVRFSDYTVMADSLFFRTLGIPVLSGDPVKDLQQKDVVFLSDRLARKMFGNEDPIGKIICYDKQLSLTVRGTYAALPQNSTINPEAVISIASAWSRGWADSSWGGGDSFIQYLRLRPGVQIDVEQFNARLDAMTQRYVPRDDPQFQYTCIVRPLIQVYSSRDDVRRMNIIQFILGLAILFIAALNYVLISISSLSRRAKAVGVHKCSGASGGRVFSMFLLETGIVLLLSVGLMALLLVNFREVIEDTVAVRLSSLFTAERLWVPLTVLVVLFVVGGVLPGRLFARIPVSQVFRRYTEGKKGWKRPLLFVQFMGVAFICGLMCVVMAQYRYVLSLDPGYDARRVATTDLRFDTDSERDAARQFFLGLPYVEAVESALYPPNFAMSGISIQDDSGRSLFSSRYCIETEGYPRMMGMTLKQGRMARERNETVVNETFARIMHWPEDDILGRIIHHANTSLGDLRVVGLLKDFHTDSYYIPQEPLLVRAGSFGESIHVRLKEPFADNLRKLNETASEAFSTQTVDFVSLEQSMEDSYNVVRIFRNATVLAGVTMFFVMLMGLVGYTTDEVRRRSKEIAIRKVNGAEARTILEMLSKDVLLVAAPAVLVGTAAAWFVNGIWMELFAVQASVGWPMYVLVALGNVALITACVVWKAWRIANENPVKSIKSE